MKTLLLHQHVLLREGWGGICLTYDLYVTVLNYIHEKKKTCKKLKGDAKIKGQKVV